MANTFTLSFDTTRFNRLFPFYILLREDLTMMSVGRSLKKICSKLEEGQAFSESFRIKRPALEAVSLAGLQQLSSQMVVLEYAHDVDVTLRGQLEWLDAERQMLFMGSPWFGSMDQVRAHELMLADFALHDPMIDLLHILKAQEIATDEIKQLLQTVQQQKAVLKDDQRMLQRLSKVASANENGVLFISATGFFTWANEGFCRLSGYSQAELRDKTPAQLYKGPLSEKDTLRDLIRAFRERRPFDLELILYRKDASWFWARLRGQPVYNGDLREEEYFLMVEDISKAKAQEEQLRVLSLIAEDNINAVILADAEGYITWVNKSFVEMTGYTLDDVKGRKPGHVLQGPDTDPESVAYLRRQIQKQEPFSVEILNYKKNQDKYWLRVKGQPIRNAAGVVTGYFAMEEDITQEREDQDKLRLYEDRFRVAFEKLGDNVWEHNFKTNATYFSASDSHLLGYNFDHPEENATLWWDRVHPEDRMMLERNDKLYKDGDIDHHTLEYRMLHRDGSIRWVLDRGVVIEKDWLGRPVRIIGSHSDITHIKHTEQELKQLVKQFQSLSENIPGVIYEYEFRPDGTEGFRYMSPAIEKIFGIPPEDYYPGSPYIHPEDEEELRRKEADCRATLAPFYAEARLLIPSRGIVWHSVSSSYSYTTSTGALVFTGFMLDITERKNADEALRMKEEKYRSIISNMNLGLLEFDVNDRIQFANQRFCLMCGFTEAELRDKKFNDLFHPADNTNLAESLSVSQDKGYVDAYEVLVLDKNGERRWWLISAAPRYNSQGEWEGTIGIHLDITPQKRLERELIQARELAESSSEAKQLFLANMSHEIRTPLNAILGMANQLAKTKLESQQRLYLDTITNASENLLIIINDILDLSKIEAGKLSLEKIAFESKPALTRALQVMMIKAEEKGLQLTNSLMDEKLSPVLIGDPYRLNQVLLNLISNAIKFTDRGYVDLTCIVVKDTPTDQVLLIEVKDTGIGMDQEFIRHLFDKFSQEDASVTRKYGGTGLGMSICKNLVELMGGEIRVYSRKDAGTRVSFTVQLSKGTVADLPRQKMQQPLQVNLKGKRILIVDDNDVNRLVAKIILNNAGVITTEASNGAEALSQLRKHNVDLVLMDIQMPVMDGEEAVRIIRQEISTTLPVVALTANAIKGDHDRFVAAGMNDYLSKPFQEQELLQVIRRCLELIQSSPTDAPRPEPARPALYNLSEVRAFSHGNAEFVDKMIRLFIEDTPVQVNKMKSRYHDKDLEAMGALAHKIKPSLDTFGVSSLREPIRAIERFGKLQEDDPSLHELIDKVERQVNHVVDALRHELGSP